MFVNFKKAGNGSPVILAINTDKIISINLAANGTRGSVTLASRALDVFIESGTINTLKDLGFVQVGTKLINSALVEYITQTDKRISLIDGTELNEEQLALFLAAADKNMSSPKFYVSKGFLDMFKDAVERNIVSDFRVPIEICEDEFNRFSKSERQLLRNDLLQPKAKELPTPSTRVTDDTQAEYIWSNSAAEATTEAQPQKPKRKKKE